LPTGPQQVSRKILQVNPGVLGHDVATAAGPAEDAAAAADPAGGVAAAVAPAEDVVAVPAPAELPPPALGPDFVEELDPSIAVAADLPVDIENEVDTAASKTIIKPKTKTYLYSW
jgi:hypothetical protein